MNPKSATGTLVASIALGAARVALGALWLHEGILKLRANFGGADIKLVVDTVTSDNTRSPGFFRVFADNVLGDFSGFFGFAMPWLEVGLGLALILGILTFPAALGSMFTLMTYWLSDQLVWQYPVMTGLSVLVIAWPALADKFSVTEIIRRRRSSGAGSGDGSAVRSAQGADISS